MAITNIKKIDGVSKREDLNISVRSDYLSKWRNQASESSEIINDYITRRNNQEWMSADDISNYRSALKRYKSSTAVLMRLQKSSGNYKEEDEKKWNEYISSLSTDLDTASEFYGKYKTQYDYDAYLLNGPKDFDGESISNRKNAYDSLVTRLAELNKQIDESGYDGYYFRAYGDEDDIPEEYTNLIKERDKLQAELTIYERGGKVTDELYNQYSANEDWAEDSANRDFNRPTKDNLLKYGTVDPSTYEYYSIDKSAVVLEDPLGTYLAIYNGEAGHEYGGNVVPNPVAVPYDFPAEKRKDTSDALGYISDYNDNFLKGQKGHWENLSDDEISLYYYLLSNGQKEQAMSYLYGMETELGRRATAEYQMKLEEAGALELVFHNAMSVPANIIGGATAFLDDTINTMVGKDINPYDGGHSIQNYAQGVRTATANDINKATGASDSDWLTWGDAYQGLMSGVDSAVGGLTLGKGYSVLMGMGAASSEAKELYEKGASKDQIVSGGLLAGAMETAFEYFSIGYFLDDVLGKPAKNVGQLFLKTLGMAGVEASEEFCTTIGNYIADAYVMGGASDWAGIIDKYKNEGYSDGDAVWQAIKEVGGEALHDAAIGAISGGGMGAVGNTASAIGYSNAVAAHGKGIIEEGGVDYLKELADEVAGVTKGKKIPNLSGKVTAEQTRRNAGRVGQLSVAIDEALVKQNKADIVKALEEKGVSKMKARQYAAILVEMNGEFYSGAKSSFELGTDAQWEKITGDPNAYSILREVVTDMDSSVNARNRKYGYARRGIKFADDGTVSLSEERAKKVEEAVLGSKYAEEADSIEATVSKDGKAKVISTDTEVTLQGIDHIETEQVDGKETDVVYLKVADADGTESTVAWGDVEFANRTEAVLYESFVNMGLDPAHFDAYIKNFNEADFDTSIGEAAIQYAHGFANAYRYGWANLESEVGSDVFASKLTETARNIAYTIGKEAVTKSVEAKQKELDDAVAERKASKKGKSRKKGKVYFKGDRASLTDRQKASVTALDKIADALGVSFYLYESRVENGKRVYTAEDGTVKIAPNGMYNTANGRILIDINAGAGGEGTIMFTAAHELIHYIKQWSPAKFKVLADFLMEQYGKKGVSVDSLVQAQIDLAEQNGETLDYDAAFEEVVADSMETMLADGKIAEKLALLKAKDKGLVKKIKQFFAELIVKLREVYAGLAPNTQEGQLVAEMTDAIDRIQELFAEALVDASETYQWIGARDIDTFAEAKTTDGDTLFQHRAMEADKAIYREMLLKHGQMTSSEIDTLFRTIDKALDVIKSNLEALDYAWEADINDRAFAPIKPNRDSLYKVSLDFSTLCRKRILQQLVQARLQEALNKPLSREEGIAIRDELMKIQAEGRQIEIACALCYVESARMKSNAQIKKFLANRESVITEFLASKSGGSIKQKVAKAEAEVRERLGVGNASLKSLPQKVADQIRDAKRKAKKSYEPTYEEQKLIDAAMSMTITDFTTPVGLENLAKNYPVLFDAYTSYIRNATKSKGIENDTWFRAGDTASISDTLIANMNRENGLRSQSWSDFQVIHLLDYIAATIELSTRNAKEQAYSKVPDYIDLMGNTGVMLNMSLIPTSVFNGGLEYDPVEGIDYKRSLALRDKYHATAGTICIGINNKQIALLLADGTIDYVIPYHKSGMAAHIRKMMHLPKWEDYEPYQRETELSRKEAEANARKYGVELLDESDPNYHKHTSFSEWFDLEVAQQIARMENANPTNKKAQKKYGVMYGGYMAMQNAANNYLRLCAERGIAPKFSHEKADFTAEENYWKLLIDRKMVDNVTGEIIVQQAIKPVFDEGEVLRILNDELERYPKVKGDQEYAIRTVMERFLSGEMNSRLDADTIAAIMQKPVNNVTATSILASSNKYGELLSMGEGVKKSSRKTGQSAKNPYNVDNGENTSKEGLIRGESRQETREAFLRRAVQAVLQVKTRGKVAYGYRRTSPADVTERSRQAEEELKKLGVPSVVYDVLEENRDGVSSVVTSESTTIRGDAVYINNALIRDPKEVAGHEAYHFWKLSNERDVYSSVLEDNIIFSSNDFEVFVSEIADGYSLDDEIGSKQWETLMEEVYAYISGFIHSGDSDLVKKFISDFSEVEAAWNDLVNSRLQAAKKSSDGTRYSKRQKAHTFYSYMGVVVDGLKDGKYGAASIINMLKGKGVKDEEIKWSGIETWLEGKKSVTKAELQEFIAGSQLEIGEQTSSNDIDLRYDTNSRSYTLYDKSGNVISTYTYNEFIGGYVSENDDEIYIDAMDLEDALREEYGSMSSPRWGQYTLDGGTNYREIVFTMPNSTYSNNAMQAHWGQDAEGVLAHARIQDFVDADGRRMLFIEEIQSDWHNEGRKRGYVDKHYQVTIKNTYVKHEDGAYRLYRGKQQLYAHINDAVLQRRFPNGITEEQIHQGLVDKHNKDMDGTVPDVPFRDTYHEYVLKRLIRMAAEEGYDSIGWTTAQIQSDRWSDQYAEGYRIEYDQDIPKFLRKYGKKWGAEVGKTALNNKSDRDAYIDNNGKEYKSVREWYESVMDSYVDYSVWTAYIAGGTKVIQDGDTMKIQVKRTGEILPEELHITAAPDTVWSMPITDSMKDSVLYEGQVMYQRRGTGMSNRSILANALESATQHESEARRLAEYKEKINLINAEEEKLREVRARIAELSFASGPKDTATIKRLQETATRIASRINTYDKQLLSLEATTPLRALLEREKTAVRKREKERAAEALARYREKSAETIREVMTRNTESRKRSVESRKRTVTRNKIKRVVADLNGLLNRGTKERNVKTDMRETVGSALRLANVLFNDEITNEDIVLMGSTMATMEEQKLLKQYRELIEKRDSAPVGEAMRYIDKISVLNRKLADLFKRERARLNQAKVSEAVDELAKAYAGLKVSDKDYVSAYYSEEAYQRLMKLSKDLGGTVMKDMSLEQLEEVYNAYKMIRHIVRESNSLFRMGKTEDLAKRVAAVQGQILSLYKEREKDPRGFAKKYGDIFKGFLWNGMKPLTAFETLGAEAFTELFWDAIKAEAEWAKWMEESKAFLDEQREKYGYKSWDMETAHEFTLPDGKVFRLTVQDMMSIYAYSKRDQAEEHMTFGGFQFADYSEYKDDEGVTRVHSTSDLYVTDWTTIGKIIGALTDEQKHYVDAVQQYLTDMGERGNEVSEILYGIGIFNETAYFPLMSAKDYLSSVEEALNATPTLVSLKNTGMTQQTAPHASNPIILQGFDDVAIGHIDKMAKYCTHVLPIENLRRVFDSVTATQNGGYVSTKAVIERVFGKGAQKYIEQYITDLNGGVFVDGPKIPAMAMFSKFKATAVGASLSVVVQQPFAVIRAMDVIDPKHFVGKVDKAETKRLYDEIMRYAPVAIIKEMGGFDVGSSRTARDYLGSGRDKGILDKVNDVAMYGAGWADRVGWGIIWNAVKREVASEGKYELGSEEYLKACGERFTEVIVRTQVYDSVNSRSGIMRSKSDIDKFITSFMGEPTTVVNQAYLAILNVVRAKGKSEKASAKRQLGRTMGVLLTSTLLTTIAKSFIYAMRDDDDDEAFFERWAKHTGENLGLFGDLNPLTMLPYARDLISLFEGYDIERPDTTLIGKAIKSLLKVLDRDSEEQFTNRDEVLALFGDVANLLGVPAKNAIRDVKAIYNFFDDIFDEITPTDVGGAFVSGFTGEEYTEKTRAENVFKKGDNAEVKRIVQGMIKAKVDSGKTEKEAKSAVRSSFTSTYKEQYVKAYKNGDLDEMNRIRKYLHATGLYGTLSELDESLKKWRED